MKPKTQLRDTMGNFMVHIQHPKPVYFQHMGSGGGVVECVNHVGPEEISIFINDVEIKYFADKKHIITFYEGCPEKIRDSLKKSLYNNSES